MFHNFSFFLFPFCHFLPCWCLENFKLHQMKVSIYNGDLSWHTNPPPLQRLAEKEWIFLSLTLLLQIPLSMSKYIFGPLHRDCVLQRSKLCSCNVFFFSFFFIFIIGCCRNQNNWYYSVFCFKKIYLQIFDCSLVIKTPFFNLKYIYI